MYAVLVVLELEHLAEVVVTQETEELQDLEICYPQQEGKEAAQIPPMRRIREALEAQVVVAAAMVAETEALTVAEVAVCLRLLEVQEGLTAEAAVAEALALPEKVEPMAGMEARTPLVETEVFLLVLFWICF